MAAWLALVMVLLLVKPKGGLLAEALRLLADLLRLLRRLAADASVKRAGFGFASGCSRPTWRSRST